MREKVLLLNKDQQRVREWDREREAHVEGTTQRDRQRACSSKSLGRESTKQRSTKREREGQRERIVKAHRVKQ